MARQAEQNTYSKKDARHACGYRLGRRLSKLFILKRTPEQIRAPPRRDQTPACRTLPGQQYDRWILSAAPTLRRMQNTTHASVPTTIGRTSFDTWRVMEIALTSSRRCRVASSCLRPTLTCASFVMLPRYGNGNATRSALQSWAMGLPAGPVPRRGAACDA